MILQSEGGVSRPPRRSTWVPRWPVRPSGAAGGPRPPGTRCRQGLGVAALSFEHTVATCWSTAGAPPTTCSIKTRVSGLDLIPSEHRPLGRRDPARQRVGREQSLARAPPSDRRLRADRLPTVAGSHRQRVLACADGGDHRPSAGSSPCAVWRCSADIPSTGPRPAQPATVDQRHPDHPVRQPHGERPR